MDPASWAAAAETELYSCGYCPETFLSRSGQESHLQSLHGVTRRKRTKRRRNGCEQEEEEEEEEEDGEEEDE